MKVEFIEILDFLNSCPPFDALPDEERETLPPKLTVRYARRGQLIMEPGEMLDSLQIIRTGAVEIHMRDGRLLTRLEEGHIFGAQTLLRGRRIFSKVTAIEDSLIYQLPSDDFFSLFKQYYDFKVFFGPVGGDRLRRAIRKNEETGFGSVQGMNTLLADLITREPVWVSSDAPIMDAAQMMVQERVSSLLIMDDGRLTGLITDQDIRRRVVARGRAYSDPVGTVMTGKPVSIVDRRTAFDALIKMAKYNIHHLPVHRGEEVLGLVTPSDLDPYQRTSVVYLVGEIAKMSTVEELRTSSLQIPKLFLSLSESGASAHKICHTLTVVANSIAQNILKIAEETLGEPPVAYAWVATGSQARDELTVQSDQDNCLILEDEYDPDLHGDYFKRFSEFVCRALDQCGYVFCPGDSMASNSQWRQPLSVWKEYFDRWINEPDPRSIMFCGIFFDMKFIHGDERLFWKLRECVAHHASQNQIFLAYMAANALSHRPPLGIFRSFVLEHEGQHHDMLDLKKNGVIPVVDLARVNALKDGIQVVNTRSRIQASQKVGGLSTSGARDLLAALNFINNTRLRYHARLMVMGKEPDNFFPPDDLSDLERHHLKDAFSVVQTIQSALEQRYQLSRFK
ncbi:MAG: cyclic nucleotide-binding/CBS domain-containing protein [Magnetococcales bacterium]|nr:cyclic nucleotide-binding/CBS domain-containing protein [Magnetococcales bacterium]